jgi:hypothetical protein
VVALKLRAVYRGEKVFGCEAVRAKLQKERIHLVFIQLRSESLNCKESWSSVMGVACFELPMTLSSQPRRQTASRPHGPAFFLPEFEAKKLLEVLGDF